MIEEKNNYFTSNEIICAYEQIPDLLRTRYIITDYSTNKNDIRTCSLENLDLKNVKTVLELGCGYGFFVEKLYSRLHQDAKITGIDLVNNNREIYLHSIATTGYSGDFICDDAHIIQNFDSEMYDLIISSYSLYFFPYLIKELSRLLKKNGIFIAITHSKYSLHEIIELLPLCISQFSKIQIDEFHIQKLFSAFSLENGLSQLQPYFKTIEKISYANKIKFPFNSLNDCISYLNKKKNLIYKDISSFDPHDIVGIESCIEKKIFDFGKNNNGIELTKDDAIFRCFKC